MCGRRQFERPYLRFLLALLAILTGFNAADPSRAAELPRAQAECQGGMAPSVVWDQAEFVAETHQISTWPTDKALLSAGQSYFVAAVPYYRAKSPVHRSDRARE